MSKVESTLSYTEICCGMSKTKSFYLIKRSTAYNRNNSMLDFFSPKELTNALAINWFKRESFASARHGIESSFSLSAMRAGFCVPRANISVYFATSRCGTCKSAPLSPPPLLLFVSSASSIPLLFPAFAPRPSGVRPRVFFTHFKCHYV